MNGAGPLSSSSYTTQCERWKNASTVEMVSQAKSDKLPATLRLNICCGRPTKSSLSMMKMQVECHLWKSHPDKESGHTWQVATFWARTPRSPKRTDIIALSNRRRKEVNECECNWIIWKRIRAGSTLGLVTDTKSSRQLSHLEAPVTAQVQYTLAKTMKSQASKVRNWLMQRHALSTLCHRKSRSPYPKTKHHPKSLWN